MNQVNIFNTPIVMQDRLPVIKEEDCFQRSSFFCLNPFCTDNENRKFQNEDRHFFRQKCKKWLVNQKLLNKNREPFPTKDINNIFIDFQNCPLQTYQILARLKISNWQKVLDEEQKKIKKEINRAIDVQFQTVKTKIHEIIKNASLFESHNSQVVSAQDPNSFLNNFYEQHLSQLTQLKNRILFKKVNFKSTVADIKESIEKIFQTIIEDTTFTQGFLSQQQQRNFHQFMFQQTNEKFNKLQILTSALKKKSPEFGVQNEKIHLQCCLCNRKVQVNVNPTILKAAKKKLSDQIITHLYSDHYEQVGFAYCKSISKSFVNDLKFQQFLSLSKKYEQVTIVDRQSGVAFEEKFQDRTKSPSNFIIEIVSMKNAAMARGKHILVHNHLSIDSLIAIISYICTQRDQNVEIMTKKTSYKSGIQDLLWCKTTKIEQ